MTEINLLPWREDQREREKKRFIGLLSLCLIMTLLLVFLMNSYAVYLEKNQQSGNEILQRQISILNKQIKEQKKLEHRKVELLSRMSVVSQLQSSRILVIHLFDELTKIMPPGAYARQLERQADGVTLWGNADSNASISLLLKNIDMNEWLQSPVLGEIKQINDAHEFKLSFLLRPKAIKGKP